MTSNIKNSILIFKNTREVIKAENICIKNNFKHKIMPVPRNISSECGMCIFVDNNDSAKIIDELIKVRINCKIG